MIERIDQRQCRCAVEGPTVVKRGGDCHRRLVDVGNAEVDLPHDGRPDLQRALFKSEDGIVALTRLRL